MTNETEPEEVARYETPLGAVVTLTTSVHLGDGLILATRMKDDDGRWFSVYLDRDNLLSMAGVLLGFTLRRGLEDLGKELND